MAAGSTHCLALTEDSEVHSWGSNDQCQHFDTLRVTKPEPTALPGLDTKHIVGIACGPAQVLTAELGWGFVQFCFLNAKCSLLGCRNANFCVLSSSCSCSKPHMTSLLYCRSFSGFFCDTVCRSSVCSLPLFIPPSVSGSSLLDMDCSFFEKHSVGAENY